MTSRRSLLSGRTCQRIGHAVTMSYLRRTFRCHRCRKHVDLRGQHELVMSTRYPLQERWRRHGRTWYIQLLKVLRPGSRSHRELWPHDRVLITEDPTFESLDKLA